MLHFYKALKLYFNKLHTNFQNCKVLNIHCNVQGIEQIMCKNKKCEKYNKQLIFEKQLPWRQKCKNFCKIFKN